MNAVFAYSKLQIGCMLILLYITLIYFFEERRHHRKHKNQIIFDTLLFTALIEVLFDGLTAYTVNHPDTVSPTVNMLFHLFFLLGIDTNIFLLFLYTVNATHGLPKKLLWKLVVYVPYLLNVIVVVVNIPTLSYLPGSLTNYSMGVSAYTCFAMVAIYVLLTIAAVVRYRRDIEGRTLNYIITYLILLAGIAGYQMVFPQSLVSSLCTTIVVLGIYINQENPTVRQLEHYHSEMIMGFATLVESKDDETGGHIKRTTGYVRLLAEELRHEGMYRDTLSRDYIRDLCLAAPMHDIGKIAMPDRILKKADRLTDAEYEEMKQHTVLGSQIIQDTFGHLDDGQYATIAYQVARYHHEKWDGSGYPEGLSGKEIPLCARIMAIADVFDAIAESRRYRGAMSLDACFDIIKNGSGTQFDPVLVGYFLSIRDRVTAVHDEFSGT